MRAALEMKISSSTMSPLDALIATCYIPSMGLDTDRVNVLMRYA